MKRASVDNLELVETDAQKVGSNLDFKSNRKLQDKHCQNNLNESGNKQNLDKIILSFVYISRYFVLCVCGLLLCISVLYTVGSVSTIAAENFWCPVRTEDEVRKFNFENDFPRGNTSTCHYIDSASLNYGRLKYLTIDSYVARIDFDNEGASSLIQFIIYCLISLFLFVIILYHCYFVLYDTFAIIVYGRKNKRIKKAIEKVVKEFTDKQKQVITKTTEKEQQVSVRNFEWLWCCCRCVNIYYCFKENVLDKYIKPRYYNDSKLHLINTMVREIIEICIQTYALLLYGGLDIFDPNRNVLAQRPLIIQDMAIILGLNCIFTGIIFMLYIVKHNVIHGKSFLTLVFIVDTTFEIFYVLFPLLYLTHGDSLFDLRSLGLLKQENTFVFFQSIWALLLLTRKCHKLFKDLNPKYIIKSYWKNIKRNTNFQPWIDILDDKNVSHNSSLQKTFALLNNNEILYKSVVNSVDPTLYSKFNINTIEIHNNANRIRSNSNSAEKGDLNESTGLPGGTVQSEEGEHLTVAGDVATASDAGDVTDNSDGVADGMADGVDDNVRVADDVKDNMTHDEKDEHVENTIRNDLEMKNHQKQQCRRKTIVFAYGLLLLSYGISIIALVSSFIYNEFDSKCIVDNDNTINSTTSWLSAHPELYFYDKYCNHKVVNLFNYDYPCNCRLLLYKFTDINQSEFSNSLIRYTNLEGLTLEGLPSFYFNAQPQFNLTSEMIENLIYLKTLRLSDVGICYIDSEAIKNLKNLRVFQMGVNYCPVYMPFESLSSLTNLVAISIEDVFFMTNEEISREICKLSEVRYFNLGGIFDLTHIPFDCIAQNWQKLEYLEVRGVPLISYMTPKIWSLPQLSTVILSGCNFNQSTLNFDGYYSDDLKKVAVYGNYHICAGNISINGKSYRGFEYLDNSDDEDELLTRQVTLSFIEQFDPCYEVCENGGFSCWPTFWQDGVCDRVCNNEQCGYDGGDCIQTCDAFSYNSKCNTTLLFNDKCDIECNTTECGYDLYACVVTEEVDDFDTGACFVDNNITDGENIMFYNGSYIYNYTSNTTYACYNEWTYDEWCDSICDVESCNFDYGMCYECGGMCEEMTSILAIGITIGKEETNPFYEVATLPELCENWALFSTLLDSVGIDGTVYHNCSLVFGFLDGNDNGYVGFHEVFVHSYQFFNQGELLYAYKSDEKIGQIDCGICLKNQSLYYW